MQRAELVARYQTALEILDGLDEPHRQDLDGLPVKLLHRERNVRLATRRIVLRQGPEHQLRAGSGELDNPLSQITYGNLVWITEIDWPNDIVGAVHKPQEPGDHIVDVTE